MPKVTEQTLRRLADALPPEARAEALQAIQLCSSDEDRKALHRRIAKQTKGWQTK